eukprot:4095321-Pleurochrysis_carterae.AAC.1
MRSGASACGSICGEEMPTVRVSNYNNGGDCPTLHTTPRHTSPVTLTVYRCMLDTRDGENTLFTAGVGLCAHRVLHAAGCAE